MKTLFWFFQFAFGCHHRQLSRVFTIKKRTYRVCFECGQEFEYSWEAMRAAQALVRATNIRPWAAPRPLKSLQFDPAGARAGTRNPGM